MDIESMTSSPDDVRAHLQGRDSLVGVSLQTVARACGVTPDALYRRLKLANTSFTDLLEAERRRRCMARLSVNRRYEGTRLARQCGYAFSNSFYRAFQAWYGVSLSDWRRAHD